MIGCGGGPFQGSRSWRRCQHVIWLQPAGWSLRGRPPEEKIRWEHKSPFCGPRIRLFRVEESGLCIAIPAFVYAKDAVLGILTRCLRDNRVIQWPLVLPPQFFAWNKLYQHWFGPAKKALVLAPIISEWRASCHRTQAGFWQQRLGIYGDEEGTGPDTIGTAGTASFPGDDVFAVWYSTWQLFCRRQLVWRTASWCVLMD